MNALKNMSVSRKLISGFLVVAIIASIIGGVGIFGTLKISNGGRVLFEEQTKPMGDMFTIVKTIYQMRLEMRTAVINSDSPEKVASSKANFEKLDKTLTESIAKYEPSLKSEESKALFAEATELYNSTFKKVASDTFRYAALNQPKEADKVGATSSDAVNKMIANYDKCLENRINNAKKTSDSDEALANIITYALIAIAVVGITASVLLGIGISKNISEPISSVVDASEKLALGHTDFSIPVQRNDEFGKLAQVFNNMIEGIKQQAEIANTISHADFSINVVPRSENDTMGKALKYIAEALNKDFLEIKQSAEQISLGSEQVSNGAQMLSQGATEQASSIEELSASINEVAEQVKQNVNNVGLAKTYVEQAGNGVAQSNIEMKNMLVAMNDINQASSEISKIIKVIDDIAFQTNILALNAAVEAARAGAAGKGFAVVAEEVRNLASKSAEAAKHTTELIDKSISTVNNGSKIAEKTATALADAEAKAGMVVEAIEKVSVASNEQAIAIDQINTGVEQISTVIQTNSATAEESAASSEELSGLASILYKMASRMKLREIGTPNLQQGNKIVLDENVKATKSDKLEYISSNEKY